MSRVRAGHIMASCYYTVDKLVDMLGDNFIWHRFTINNERQYKHYTQICGHNRVQSIEYVDEPKIIKRDGFIYIDCGVDLKNGKLACLRLDDMCEFYV